MILNTAPSLWNSVHRPIEFIYDNKVYDILGVGLDNGNVYVQTTVNLSPAAVAGESVVIFGIESDGESIDGTYVITAADPNFLYLDLPADNVGFSGSTATVTHIRLPEIKLYSGYLTGEEYPDDLPITLVATFTPENSPDNDIRFDVSEYLKSIFRIVPPSEGVDFNMFNRFRLFFDGVYHETYQVLNSSITTAVLMSDYANTGNPLNPFFPPIVFGCGRTIISYLENNVVTNVISINDDITEVEGDYYHGDYSASDYYVNN